ncbi:hypothetical protein GCM10011371_07870 [Novosphingobium marinum]|uniref:CHRD domain-containing protein n=1 Tax=Novosphingobium marinum TaxID=1514948 RepID=A0A7Z0BUN0_9SPHN|nr:hypothetical protein [Novosphingobium marinum]NYH94475.1 hypothetical protein [Novosphingobium marinum]GGC22593.1 hypothetical protein GCM10011371_07870 [Novosphingobium marinum]
MARLFLTPFTMDGPTQLAFNATRLTGEGDFLGAEEIYFTSLTALNDSGVNAVALIGFDDDTDTITVSIRADGLEADQLHPQHIHGFMGDDPDEAMLPTMDADTDGDGFIELLEAAPSYGPVLLSLTDDGMADAFPMAEDGTISFTETYSLPMQDLGDDPMLDLREIVLHGMSVDGSAGDGTDGEIDGTAGYKATLPVAAGELDMIEDTDGLLTALGIDGIDFGGFGPPMGDAGMTMG